MNKEAGGKTYEESITTTEILEGTSSGMLTFNGSPVYSEGGVIEWSPDLDITKGCWGQLKDGGTQRYHTIEQNDYEGRN